jgi:hypothetical protein
VNLSATLTDGTGVSSGTWTKFTKDFVADFLLTASATLAVTQIMDLGAAIQAPETAGLAIGGAAVRAGYRALLRWATT